MEWSSPYVEAPGGVRVAMEVFIPASDEGCRAWPKEMEEKYWELRQVHRGPMYCHVIRAISRMPKRMSVDQLKGLRRKRLMRRMEEKYPLFAGEFAQEEMIRKEPYYNGITDAKLEDLRDCVEREHDELLRRYGVNG